MLTPESGCGLTISGNKYIVCAALHNIIGFHSKEGVMFDRTITAIGTVFSGVSRVVLGTSEVSGELERQRFTGPRR